MFWIPMAVGAGIGALTNRKNPLKGALMGAGLGSAGGGLLSAAGAAGGAGAAGAGSQAGLLAAQEAGLGATSLGWGGATTGLQGGLNSVLGSGAGSSVGGLLGNANTAMQYVEPLSKAMNTAGMFRPEDKEQTPITPSPFANTGNGGAQAGLSNVLGNSQQIGILQMQNDAKKRAEQRARIARIGGY